MQDHYLAWSDEGVQILNLVSAVVSFYGSVVANLVVNPSSWAYQKEIYEA